MESPMTKISEMLDKMNPLFQTEGIIGETPIEPLKSKIEQIVQGFQEQFDNPLEGPTVLPPRGTGRRIGRAGDRRFGLPRSPLERMKRHSRR